MVPLRDASDGRRSASPDEELVVEVQDCLKSHWFILGDIYGYYDEYLRSFMGELQAKLNSLEASDTTS